jgi:Tol biopolymer transport system component
VPTSTISSAIEFVGTSTPTIPAVDFVGKLSHGLYLAYWSLDTWYIRSIGDATSMVLLPGINSELYTDIQLSRDNSRIAFSDSIGEVSIYDLHTGLLATYPNSEISHAYQFQWLPDGDTLLYLGTPEQYWIPDAQVGMYSISLQTGKTTKVVDWEDNRYQHGLDNLSISKDGKWLAFDAPQLSEMMAPDPEYAVYVMDLSCIENSEDCIEAISVVSDGYAPNWAPDGKLWWICSQQELSALCVAETQTFILLDAFVTASELTNSPEAVFSYFSWSPDGKYIAANVEQAQRSESDDTRDEIYLIPVDGGQPVRLTATSDKNQYLKSWSADGRYLAYCEILGYTEPQGELGMRFAITDLYLYDLQDNTKIDLVNTPSDREVFGFFMKIE